MKMEKLITEEQNSWLVSVIVPVYNVRPYLEEALDSVVNQTYRNLEIIVIDDGSTDGSGEMCDQYAARDERIRVIHQENRGLSAARNVGLDIMTGQAVAFLDSDDAFHPEMVQRMLEAMIENETDIVTCEHVNYRTTKPMPRGRLREKRKQIAVNRTYDGIQALRALADDKITTAAWDKLYSREQWNTIRFPTGHVYEDRYTLFEVLFHTKTLFVLDETLYMHRTRPGSITTTRSINNVRDWILAHKKWNMFVETHTPEVFTPEHLKNVQQSILKGLIAEYSKLRFTDQTELRAAEVELREQITALGETKTAKGDYDIKTRTAWWMFCRCPQLLRIAYPAYLSLRRLQLSLQRR